MNTHKLLVSVLMLVSVLLSSCAPAATSTALPPTATLTAVAPTAVQTKTRSFHLFDLPVSVSFDAEWSVAETYPDVVSLVRRGPDADIAFINVKYVKIAGPEASAESEFSKVPFPDDFATWIQAHGLFQVEETLPVLVGGFQGIQINATTTAACGGSDRGKKDWIFLRETSLNCIPGDYWRFIYLNDVYGERILIMNSAGFGSSAEDFKVVAEASQKVLDTVVFSKP